MRFSLIFIKVCIIILALSKVSFSLSILPDKKYKDPIISSLSGAYIAGHVALAEGDFYHAALYYKRVILLDPSAFSIPSNSAFQKNLSTALLLSENFDDLVSIARKQFWNSNSIDLFSLFALITDSIKKHNYKTASYMTRFIDPTKTQIPWIYPLLQAWIHFSSGNREEAFSFLETIKEPEALFLVLYHKALMEELAGLHKKAEETYTLLIKNFVSSAHGSEEIFLLRSVQIYSHFLMHNKQKTEALLMLDSVKDNFTVYNKSLEFLRNQIKKSTTLHSEIITPVEGISEVFFTLSIALQDQDPLIARILLSYALALKPSTSVALFQRAIFAEKENNFATAIQFYQRIPYNSPLKLTANIQIAFNLADLDKTDEAARHLKKLLLDYPDHVDVYLALGEIYISKSDFQNALCTYDKIITKLKNPQPEDWQLFFKRGIAYERLQKWSKAEPDFYKALKLFPDHPLVLNYLAYSWIERNKNLHQALELIKKAVRHRPGDSSIIDSLGWAYFRLNRFEEALKELQKAVSLHPEDPILNDHLGDAYWRLNRHREAVFQWRYAEDMNPKQEDLKKIQEKIKNGLPSLPFEKVTSKKKKVPLKNK